MFCTHCGAEVASTYKLCPSCGDKNFSQTRVMPPSQPVPPVPSTPVLPTLPNSLAGPVTPPGRKTLLIAGAAVIAVIVVALIGIRVWENAKAEAEIKKQQEMVRIELERKRKEMELELERKRREEEAARAAEQARIAEQAAREAQARREQEASDAQRRSQRVAAVRDAIGALEFLTRRSWAKEGTQVLQINNIRDLSFDIDLKCCTTSNQCKTMPLTVAARTVTDVGFLEGWSGNFTSGETCEVRFQDEVMRTVRIK